VEHGIAELGSLASLTTNHTNNTNKEPSQGIIRAIRVIRDFFFAKRPTGQETGNLVQPDSFYPDFLVAIGHL
jgi:hypothetical protein